MSTIDFEIEIPKGYYTKEELENHIKNNIFKLLIYIFIVLYE